MIAGRPIP